MRTRRLLVGIAVTISLLGVACGGQPPQSADKGGVPPVQASPASQTPVGGSPGQPAATEPKRGGTLNMSLGIDFTTFDPFYDADNKNFKPMVFDAPVRIGNDGNFELRLAESIQQSPDGKSVTLVLRKGVKFHNGREMTADDVIWSVERARNDKLGHHLSDRYQASTGATKINDYTVRIDWKDNKPDMLNAIAALYIFPKEAEKDIATKPIGTGPFKFQEWVPGDHLTLVRNEDYWQKGKPYLDKVIVKAIPDAQSRMVNLKGGSIDFLMGVPLQDKAALDKSSDISIVSQPPGFSFYTFIMNVSRPPFDNEKVRQAMNWAVDRNKILQTAFAGQGTTTVLPYGPSNWAYAKDLENYYTFNLDKAKQLLVEAGYPNGFKTSILIRGSGGVFLDQAQVYKEDLAKIGVQAEIIPIELAQYWPKLYASEFDIVSHATGEANIDPCGIFETAACCRPFRNFFQIDKDTTWFPEYKELVAQAALAGDQAKRKDLYHKAQEIYLKQGWTIATVWRQDLFAMKNVVKGFRTDMNADIWLDEASLNK